MARWIAAGVLAALSTSTAAEVAATSYAAGAEDPHPEALKISPADGGWRISVKLSGLAAQTAVHRARLAAQRGEVTDPADLLRDGEIFPMAKATGQPLALIGPDKRAFDATETVRRALAASAELELFVRQFPAWRQEATRLEVIYTGKPRAEVMPAAVTELEADAPEETCTVDMTPRRCRQFKVAPGAKVTWANELMAPPAPPPSATPKAAPATAPPGGNPAAPEVVQTGAAAADKHGLVTIEGLKVTKGRHRVTIRR